ncbi:MAG TPA: chemotaxis protein CheX [Caproiciproducens sp.]|nr:chemotaxis protein CheX [Caproiciproducens sp.]
MNEKFIESFSNSFLSVLPQLGLSNVKVNGQEDCSNVIESPGVIVIIGMIGDLRGNVIFAMKEDCAKKIASTMMCGMEITEFDAMAQSAVSELSNMLAANACTELSCAGIKADISTPTLIHGSFTATASFDHAVCIEMLVDDFSVNIYISMEQC